MKKNMYLRKTPRLILAAAFTLMALLQLFKFEDLPDFLSRYGLPLPFAWAVALVTLTVFSIPALLEMDIPRRLRAAGVVSGWIVVVFWLAIALTSVF